VVESVVLGAQCAAREALAALPPFEPVPSVAYRSQGRLLVIASHTARTERAVAALRTELNVALLWCDAEHRPPALEVDTVCATLQSLDGYLGAFEATYETAAGESRIAPFDLVLDLRAAPAFAALQPPQGYFHAPDERALMLALSELPGMTGEFEKPTFFAYKESLCAHSRSKKTGCTQCIDVCSTRAVSTAGDIVSIDPHLCMGCGACATVCPSGAMSYQYPRVADRGVQVKAMLSAWRLTGRGQVGAPTVLFHAEVGTNDNDWPAHVLPIPAWHTASIGLDVLLGAFACGAGQVALLASGKESPAYRAATARELALAQRIVNALGFKGTHFIFIDSLTQLQPPSGETPAVPAGFGWSNDKRTTLEFAIEHLFAQGSAKPSSIELPDGSLYGTVNINTTACTLCMACVGACPESALLDAGADAAKPALKFLERNCVQCGLCATTCPERAITLTPRLLLTAERKKERVLNESEPFHCVSCGKVLGTRQIVNAMLGRLAAHSMFQGEGAMKRLQMCADCRVVDMMNDPNELSILNGDSTR
jgi:ferredoxin